MNSNWSNSPETLNSAQNGDFLSPVTFKFDGWPWKTIGYLFYVAPSFVHHFIAIVEFKLKLQSETLNSGQKWQFIVICDLEIWCLVHHFKAVDEFKLELQSGNTQFGSKWAIFVPCDLEIWWMTLKNNMAPLLCYFKLCASFRSHWWTQTGVTVRNRPIWVKIDDFLSAPCDLEILRMTLKNNRAPLLSNIKLYASFHHHMWIQTGVTVRKRLSWVMTSVTLTFDLWPWPFAWISLLSIVITPEIFVMIWWREHSQKGLADRQTDRRTDGRTDWTIRRAAWSQLKTILLIIIKIAIIIINNSGWY